MKDLQRQIYVQVGPVEVTAARMAKDESRTICRQRPRIAETPFGILKSVMGL